MDPVKRRRLEKWALTVLTVAALTQGYLLFSEEEVFVFTRIAGVVMLIANLLVFVFVFVVIPWFIYHLWLRRLWRVVHIRHIRDRREIQEAASRSGEESP